MGYFLRPWPVLMASMARPSAPVAAVLFGEPRAEAFVQAALRRLLGLLSDPGRSAPQRAVAFGQALGALVDTPRVARRLLGRYEPGFCPDQRRRFALALRAYAGRFYDGRLWAGRADGVAILGSIRHRANEVVVALAIDQGQAAPPIQMSWRVSETADGWRLIDVKHRGTWLAGVHRRAFEAVIRAASGDPEALIRRLRGEAAGELQP
jgi:ABC-type transporter MlaC component